MARRLTLEDVAEMDREMLTPEIVARVIGCSPYYITIQAREDPEMLGFPVSVHGSRTLIPKRAFLRFMCGE